MKNVYSSKKYPPDRRKPNSTYKKDVNGKMKDLGNMPFAMFFNGGFAVHGTPKINELKTPDSLGCVRLHPDNAEKLNRAVKRVGASNASIEIQDRSPKEILT